MKSLGLLCGQAEGPEVLAAAPRVEERPRFLSGSDPHLLGVASWDGGLLGRAAQAGDWGRARAGAPCSGDCTN